MEYKFEVVSANMMRAIGVTSLAKLAKALDITPQSLNKHKKKGCIPAKHILNFSKKYNISIELLATGDIPGVAELLAERKNILPGADKSSMLGYNSASSNTTQRELEEEPMSISDKDLLIDFLKRENSDQRSRIAELEAKLVEKLAGQGRQRKSAS